MGQGAWTQGVFSGTKPPLHPPVLSASSFPRPSTTIAPPSIVRSLSPSSLPGAPFSLSSDLRAMRKKHWLCNQTDLGSNPSFITY